MICDVIEGHENGYVNNSSHKRGRVVGEVSLCLSCQNASTDMRYDLPGSFIRSGHLAWPKVKFSNWAFGVKIHMVRRVLTREMRWSFAVFFIFLSSIVISKNVDLTKKQHFCLAYSGKVKMWKKTVKPHVYLGRRLEVLIVGDGFRFVKPTYP